MHAVDSQVRCKEAGTCKLQHIIAAPALLNSLQFTNQSLSVLAEALNVC